MAESLQEKIDYYYDTQKFHLPCIFHKENSEHGRNLKACKLDQCISSSIEEDERRGDENKAEETLVALPQQLLHLNVSI